MKMEKDCRKWNCTLEAAMSFIGGKYKPIILWHIMQSDHPLRFSELRKRIPNATPKMLSQQLRELEEDALIHREVFPVVPPHTEYSLTDLGKTLIPLITSIREWGVFYFQYRGIPNPCEKNVTD